MKQETVSGSGISWATCKSAPRSRQITTPVPYHSVFTGRMPFLSPNQQRQSTEGTCQSAVRCLSTDGLIDLFVLFTVFFSVAVSVSIIISCTFNVHRGVMSLMQPFSTSARVSSVLRKGLLTAKCAVNHVDALQQRSVRFVCLSQGCKTAS